MATRGSNPSTALAGDFNDDGSIDLLVGSNDGILKMFLDDGGELLAAGFLDTDLNNSAMALSVIQGSRVVYVTSDGVEQAFAFSLDQFIGEERGTVADLPDNSVAIIAALVAGSAELSPEYFAGSDAETVNAAELLFFSDGSGGQRFVRGAGRTERLGPAFRTGLGRHLRSRNWRLAVDRLGGAERAGHCRRGGSREHQSLRGLAEGRGSSATAGDRQSLVGAFVKAGQATLLGGQAAGGLPGDAVLRVLVFGQSQAAPFDGCESLAIVNAMIGESQDCELLLPEENMSRWRAFQVERQTEEPLLAGLLAATLWKPEPSRERRSGGDVACPALTRKLDN